MVEKEDKTYALMLHINEKLYLALTETKFTAVSKDKETFLDPYNRLLLAQPHLKHSVLAIWPKAVDFDELKKVGDSAITENILLAPIVVGGVSITMNLVECDIEKCREVYKAGILPKEFKNYIN